MHKPIVKANILLIEDEENIRVFISTTLKNQGYKITTASTGKEGMHLSASICPDIILLDLGLPDMDGMEVIQKLREWTATPILVISARSNEHEKAHALDLGADDYITKPFGVMELISRVKALLRRTSPSVPDTPLTLSGITLHPASRSCEAAGIPVELTYKEYELLSLLIRNAGIVLTRDVLMENVWGTDFIGESRTLDVHIKTLRRKLGDEGIHIKTVRNVGYLAEEKSSSIEEGEHQWLKK